VRIRVELAIGGVPIGRQSRALANGVDVLVATPGRLLDQMERDAVRLQWVEVLVLDEADQMLDMGFIPAIRQIVAKLPSKRQNLFFSATMPQAISELAGQLLRDPVRVAVTPVASTVERVDQRVIHVHRAGKPALLADTLKREDIHQALVFTRTKHGADKVVRGLAQAGVTAAAIHGNKSQNERDRVLAAFREGRVRTLIATDIAARGIDVTGISHVFNYDLPHIPESYVHRIGRTARAGANGFAISFCDAEERPLLRAIEKLIRLTIPATNASGQSAPVLEREAHAQTFDHTKSRGETGRNAPRKRRRGAGGSAKGWRPERPQRAQHAGRPEVSGNDGASIAFLQQAPDGRRASARQNSGRR
jgi:ATP-dependent RNA helicase RhlE